MEHYDRRMPRVTFGYLTYVNERNSAYRLDDFKQSIASLPSLALGTNEIVHVDNASLEEVHRLCDDSNAFNKCFRYSTNFVDVALFYTTLWRAKSVGADYVGFLYDDSIVADKDGVSACVDFLDANPEVACLRVAKYKHGDRSFDTKHTSKADNPDSVRHFNSQTGVPLVWSEPSSVGGRTFYKNNWHYSSRPCIWRVTAFERMVEGLTSVPILQGFEKHCMERYEHHKMVTGVLDGGLVYTTTVKNSARTNELDTNTENRMRIDLSKLRSEFERLNEQHQDERLSQLIDHCNEVTAEGADETRELTNEMYRFVAASIEDPTSPMRYLLAKNGCIEGIKDPCELVDLEMEARYQQVPGLQQIDGQAYEELDEKRRQAYETYRKALTEKK